MAVSVIAKTVDLESYILLDHIINLPCLLGFNSFRSYYLC